MKKFYTALLVLLLVLGTATPVLATNTTIDTETENGSGSTNLTYTVAEAFIVKIPTTVSIEVVGRTGSGKIDVESSVIPAGKSLTVTITGAVNYADGFRLKNDSNNYIGYSIKNGETSVAKDTAFLTIVAGTTTGTATLTYTAEAPSFAGAYTDQLTFTVAVVDAVAPEL